MPEANMISVFNMHINAFNDAIKANDINAIFSHGADMLRIALNQCSRTDVMPSVKQSYQKQCSAVIDHLIKYGTSRPLVSNTGSDGGDGGVDPYYVEKKWFSDEVPSLNFTNVIGVQEVKNAISTNVVAPIEQPELYRKFRGEQLGLQILLYGPPGTGKTHIVKCLAGALRCKIAVVQTSELLASVVGVAEKNVRDIFKQASELDRCIIFFDEIDSICSARDSIDSRNTKSILTTMLTCMDGFMKSAKGSDQLRIIVAATNLPWKLDSALKRGGRFDTQIYVPLPDEKDRKAFVSPDLARIPHTEEVTADYLAKRLDGFAGADIRAIMRLIANEPLLRALKNTMNKQPSDEKITRADCEKVIGSYINPNTPKTLLQFEQYKKGSF